MDDRARIERIAGDPAYAELVARRGRFGWALTGLMLAAYFGFVLLVAFDKAFLARSIGGGATSLGIPIGLGIILFAILLTALYVRRANGVWDAQMAAIIAKYSA